MPGPERPEPRPRPSRPAGRERIVVALDRGGLLRWHLWLIEALRARYDVAVLLAAPEDAVRLPTACRAAFELERLLYRIPPGAAVDRVDEKDIARLATTDSADDGFSAAVDCTGRMGLRGQPVLTPLFDGMPGEIGLIAALLDERAVVIAIEDGEHPPACATALPALGDRRVLTHAIDNACSIAIELVIKALGRQPLAPPTSRRLPPQRRDPPALRSAQCLAFVASSLAWKVNRLLSLRLAGREQWSVAWRRSEGGGLMTEGEGDFALLRDDGRRYFADPFVARHQGRTAVLMEEFPFATQRGRISAAIVDADGAPSAPRPALEADHHLSYPHAFAHDGELWMIPESGDRARVELYRAVDFPFHWRHEATLIEGVSAYDATVLRTDEGWWMFAAIRVRRATGWDVLNLYHAPDLRGPWRPCDENPVALDAGAARPGGAVTRHGGALLRPVQDCVTSYGSAIALWRIDALGPQGLRQTQVARIVSDRFGVHTFNRAEGLEVVDGFGRTRGERSLAVRMCSPTVESPLSRQARPGRAAPEEGEASDSSPLVGPAQGLADDA